MGRASAVLLGLNGGRIVVTDLPRFEAMGRKVVEEIVSDGGQAAWLVFERLGDGLAWC